MGNVSKDGVWGVVFKETTVFSFDDALSASGFN
jgi:hypothetical protein